MMAVENRHLKYKGSSGTSEYKKAQNFHDFNTFKS